MCISVYTVKEITNLQSRNAYKKFKMVCEGKNIRTPSYAYLHICIQAKEITALEISDIIPEMQTVGYYGTIIQCPVQLSLGKIPGYFPWVPGWSGIMILRR